MLQRVTHQVVGDGHGHSVEVPLGGGVPVVVDVVHQLLSTRFPDAVEKWKSDCLEVRKNRFEPVWAGFSNWNWQV